MWEKAAHVLRAIAVAPDERAIASILLDARLRPIHRAVRSITRG